MRPHDDADAMTADERLCEVAHVLAAGILRLRARAALPIDPDKHLHTETSPESAQDCLEVPDDTVLTVHTG